MFSSNTYSLVVLAILAVAFISQEITAQEDAPPPFLQGARKEVLEDFKKLLASNKGKTDKQIDASVDAWIENQDESIKSKFETFKEDIKKASLAADAAHKAALEKFSPEAKEADLKLSAIAGNHALTAHQKGEQIEAIVKDLPPKIREEIEKAMQG